MGCARGSEIADKVWKALKPCINKDERTLAEVSKRIYEIFEAEDADDWYYQVQYKGSLFETYIRLNEPEEWKDLIEELND